MGTDTISNDELVDIKLSLRNIIAGWTDPEIQTAWYLYRDATNQYYQMGATKYYVVASELANAIGAVDYKAGNTQENSSQYVAQLERFLKLFAKFEAVATGYKQVAIGAIRDTRPQGFNPEDNTTRNDPSYPLPDDVIFNW